MATEQLVIPPISLPAGGDLSSDQYKFVRVNTSGKVVVSAAAAVGICTIGILQNAPAASDRAAAVAIGGVSKVVYHGTITAGDEIVCSSTGKATGVTSNDQSTLGVALVSGVAENIGSMLFQPRGLS